MTGTECVKIYTDGSCLGNPGPGGWAALMLWGGKEKSLQGGVPHTTNNRMELQAVIQALSALTTKHPIHLWTDSQYVRHGIMDWIHAWKKKGWLTAGKKPVKNQDLWQSLDALQNNHTVTWHWVKGHSTCPYNNKVDVWAREEAIKMKENAT